jgi:hypothetical protein
MAFHRGDKIKPGVEIKLAKASRVFRLGDFHPRANASFIGGSILLRDPLDQIDC